MCSGKSGCIRPNVVVFGQNVLFGQKLLFSDRVVVIWKK